MFPLIGKLAAASATDVGVAVKSAAFALILTAPAISCATTKY